jgi:predicted amidophosphoribosyltransferase
MSTTRRTRRVRTTGDDGRCDGCRQKLDLTTARAGYCSGCAASYLATLDAALAEDALPATVAQLEQLLDSGLGLDEHPLGALLAADLTLANV